MQKHVDSQIKFKLLILQYCQKYFSERQNLKKKKIRISSVLLKAQFSLSLIPNLVEISNVLSILIHFNNTLSAFKNDEKQ